jgi:hypothetical protein
MNPRKPRGGFTAGEFGMALLLYMALIASVCLTGGLRGTDKARQVACLSNLKQLGMAAALYAADNAGTYPGAGAALLLHPYVKNSQVFACPARGTEAHSSARDSEIPPGDELLWMQAEPQMRHRVDYCFAAGLHGDDRPGSIFAYDNVADAHPSKSFNIVRIDGATGSLPADRWPHPPRQTKEAADEQ